MKIIGKSHHERPKKIVIHGNECIILLLACYFMSKKTIKLKAIIDRWFRHSRFYVLALWRHRSWSVTSHERGVQALCKLTQRRSSLVNNNHEYNLASTYVRTHWTEAIAIFIPRLAWIEENPTSIHPSCHNEGRITGIVVMKARGQIGVFVCIHISLCIFVHLHMCKSLMVTIWSIPPIFLDASKWIPGGRRWLFTGKIK